jgi:hypothetical protein
MARRSVNLFWFPVLALFSVILLAQDCPAQCVPAPCDPDPCQGIPHAVAGSCADLGGGNFTCDCDEGYAWQGTTLTCERERLVFLVAGSFASSGNMGGLAGADALCQFIAEQGCGLTGTYKAWLGASTGDPDSRFTKDGCFVRHDGLPIASSWADLTDAAIDSRIELDCLGNLHTGEVWTGTNCLGTDITLSCEDWTSSSPDAHGGHGDNSHTDCEWASKFGQQPSCDQELAIYCFEQ